MNKIAHYLRSFVFLFVALFTSVGVYANHILAMDLYYTWLSGDTYKITAVIYGDCVPASSSVFALLSSAQPQVCIYRGSSYVTTISLNIQAPTTGVDITPVCPSQIGNTQCENPGSTIPGITRFIYSANYTLPVPTTSDSWQFAYFGNNTNSQAGRSINVTNIVNPGPTLIQLVDTLDNTVGAHNSNAQFSVIPTPFFCLNMPDSYNPGAIDPDHDSLSVINLISAVDAASTFNACQYGIPVTYTGVAWNPPFTPISATTPLNVTAGSYTYDPTTGQLNFTPNVLQRSTVVYNVREYRNGNFVGSCQREMNFLVQSCVAPVPSGGITSVTNGIKVDSAHFSTCINSGPFSFSFDPHETGSTNNITVTYSGLPPGANVTITGNGTPTPHIVFSWTSLGAVPGTSIFYLTYTDNNCPLQGTNTTAISVSIIGQPTLTHTVLSPISCNAKEAINIIPGGGGVPWKVIVSGSASQTFTNVTGNFTDSLIPGTYYIAVAPGTGTAAGSCTAYDTVVIHSSVITGDTVLCKGSVTTLSDSYSGGTWSSSNLSVATIGITSGMLTTVNTGTTVVTYTNIGCTTTTTITVNSVGQITGSNHICTGNTLTLSDTPAGGIWSSSNSSVAAINAGNGLLSGLSPGAVIISYNAGACGTATATVTVNLSPANIVGNPNICVGSTTALSDLRNAGTWSSSNTTVASLAANGAGSTIVSGSAAGVSTITYSLAGGCIVTTSLTVYAVPSVISGPAHVCTGATITLSDTLSAGTWSSGNTAIATITPATGIVSGVVPGTVVITYTGPGGCLVTASLTVFQSPDTIAGPSTSCTGASITLSDAQAGGTWSSGATGIATVTQGTGIVSGVSAGIVTITYSMPGGCIATTTLTIYPMPGPISGPNHVCTGDSIILSDAPAGTWSSSNSSAATITPVTGLVGSVAAGTTVIGYTTGGTCIVTSTVTVYQSPAVVTGPAEVCAGSAITLNDTFTGGTWSSSNTNIATVVSAGSGNGTVTGVNPGTAIITYTMPGACAQTATVTVKPQPTAITGIIHACTGLTTALSDALYGGIWSSGTSAVATIDSASGVVTGVTAGATAITYDVNGCTVTTTVTVDIQPVVSASAVNVCTNDTTLLTSTPAGGVWSSGNTTVTIISAGSGVGIVSGLEPGTTIVTYTLAGCFSTTTITMVSELPAITGGPDVCTGQSIVLSNAITGGVWSSGATTVAIVDSASGTVTGVSAGIPGITYFLGGGCITSTTVNVHQSPGPGVITGPADICIGAAILYNDTAAGGVWNISNDSATISAGSVTGVSAGTDTIMYILSNAFCTDTALKMITIYPVPDSGSIIGDTVLCLGANISLSDTVSGGVWSSVQPGIATITMQGIVTGLLAGADTIKYTNTNPGCSSTAIHLIAVYDYPGIGPVTGLNDVCSGATFTLSDTAAGGLWTSSNTGVATIDANTGVVHAIAMGNTVITYTIGPNAGGCSTDTTYAVAVSSQPLFAISSVVSQDKCYGDSTGSITITATGDTMTLAYLWSNGVTTPSITGLATGPYTLTVSDSATHCAIDTTINITEPDSIHIAAQSTKDLCMNGSGSITTVVSGGTSPYSYLWPDNSTGSSLQNLHAGAYFLTVTDGDNCTDTLSVTVENDNCDIVIHDAITPNGDGINDKWVIEGLDNYPDNTVQVFDKWGNMVYEKTGYNNDWEGRGTDGLLPDGTYYYLVKLNAKNLLGGGNTFTGSILIKR